MKDHEGYLPKGWMMHEPYCLHNGTPALAIYTYLYRTTRKNEWQGSLQTLADLVEIPLRTVRDNIRQLHSRRLLAIESISHGHYSIKALRLNREDGNTVRRVDGSDTELCGSRQTSGNSRQVECGSRQEECGSRQPIKNNINININKKETNSSRSIREIPAAPAAPEVILDRKVYITKVLALRIPEYPYAVVYEYASLVQIPTEIVDDFLTHYASTGWKMNNGGRVENWAAALKNWHKRAQRFAERDQQKTAAARFIVAHQAGQMSEKNRAVFEEEQERKRREKERRDQESQQALSYDEYQALKQRLQGSVS